MMSTCQQLQLMMNTCTANDTHDDVNMSATSPQLQLMMNTCTANDTHDDVNMSTTSTSTNDEYMHGQ